jgi:hypothetical protein
VLLVDLKTLSIKKVALPVKAVEPQNVVDIKRIGRIKSSLFFFPLSINASGK